MTLIQEKTILKGTLVGEIAMSEARYFFVHDEAPHSFDDIAVLILAGSLQSNTLIWKEGTPDWVRIKKCPDFDEIFSAYREQAKELVDKALGQDAESLERKEMQNFLSSAEEEDVSFSGTESKWKDGVTSVTILLLVLLGSVGILWGYTLYKRSNQTQRVVAATRKKEELNLRDLRFASGVTKLDSIKGITVKKIAKNEEDDILKEALIAERKQELEAQPEKKRVAIKRGIFDKVSDDELAAFRQRLISQGRTQPIRKIKSKGKASLSGEQLTSNQIALTVKRFNGTIKSCYNKSLKQDPHLSGKMEVTLHILGNGQVAKVVNNTQKFRGGTMDRCVRSTIKKKWKFPTFNGTLSTVTLPFILSRSH